MATNTTNYNLVKPSDGDKFDIEHFNGNADIIDRKLKELSDAVASGGGSGTDVDLTGYLQESELKTINGTSLVGSGDIVIEGGSGSNALILDTETGVLSLAFSSTPAPVTYSITYNINGHGTQPETVTGVTSLPTTLPVLSEAGYTFDGWYMDSALSTVATAGATITSNVTLYAKWTESAEETVYEFTANAVAGSDFKGYAVGPYITEYISAGTTFKIHIESDCFDTSMIYFSREDAPTYQLYKDNVPSNTDVDCYADFNIIGLTLRVLGTNITQSGEFKFKVII